MRVPLAGFSVLEKYGPRWSGFDTPRHRYLLAVFLLYHQAPRAGLETINVSYDSSAKRFRSEIAVHGISIKREDDPHAGGAKAFLSSAWRQFKEEAACLNQRRDRISARFLLRKEGE